MTQNQDETYFHDLGHGGACTAFYRGCFGNLFWGTCTPMFDGFSRVLMDLICIEKSRSQWHGIPFGVSLKKQLLVKRTNSTIVRTNFGGYDRIRGNPITDVPEGVRAFYFLMTQCCFQTMQSFQGRGRLKQWKTKRETHQNPSRISCCSDYCGHGLYML